MADPTILWTWLSNTLTSTTIFNIGWILSPILTLITIYAIERDKGTWGILLLPVTMMYHIIGIKTSFIQLIIGILVFGVMIFSTDISGNIITAIQTTYESTSWGKRKKTQKLFKKQLTEKTIERRLNKLSKLEPTKELLDEITEAIKKGKGK